MAVKLLLRRLRRPGHIVSFAADLCAEAFDGFLTLVVDGGFVL
jgi:hypothetical protein